MYVSTNNQIVRAYFDVDDFNQREKIMELAEIDYEITSCSKSILCHISQSNLECFKKMSTNCKVTILATVA